jgi:hypothetical protein
VLSEDGQCFRDEFVKGRCPGLGHCRLARPAAAIPLNETIAVDKASADCLFGGGECRFNLSLIGG